MADVKQLLIDTLADLYKDYPVYLQGSLTESQAYPDHFFTYWNNSTDDSAHYSNVEHSNIWDFDLNFYSVDPDKVNAVLLTVKAALRVQGFLIGSVGYDVMSDEETHTGRGMNVIYIDF